MRTTLTVLYLVAAASTTLAEPTPKYLTVAEMMARVQSSGVHYAVSTAPLGNDPANAFWPPSTRWPDSPLVVTDATGGRYVMPRGCPREATAAIAAGEPAFRAKRYAEARAAYEPVTKQFPDCMSAWLDLGDTFFYEHADVAALAAYERARAARPDDPTAYFYGGQVLLRLRRREEALAWFRKALAIRPNYPALAQFLAAAAPRHGFAFHEGFSPRAYARGTAPNVEIIVAPGSDEVAWLSYGICRGFLARGRGPSA